MANTSKQATSKSIRRQTDLTDDTDEEDRDDEEDLDDGQPSDDGHSTEEDDGDDNKPEIEDDSSDDELIIDSEADDDSCEDENIEDSRNHNNKNGEDADDEKDECCCNQSEMSCSSLLCSECTDCDRLSDCELCMNSCTDNPDSQLERSHEESDAENQNSDASTASSSSGHLVKHWMKVGKTVFVRWTDGLYYLGKIERIESSCGLCLIHYEDDSLYWTHFKDIHAQLSPNSIQSDADIICNECGDGSSKSPNEIVICDVCNQGYHQLCHKPPIPDSILEPDIPWTCRTCIFTLAAREGGAEKDSPIGEAMKSAKVMFHYDIESLTWNDSHTSNRENIYCYCGGPGRYHSRMLQCHKCLQWFHEACIQVIESPLLYGDHFYQFSCAVCNQGEEIIRRITMKWHDLLSIVLHNLTLRHGRRFSDLNTEILPFIQKNASKFKMKCNLQKMREDELSRKVLQVLVKYRKRFTSSKDFRKKTDFWSLRLMHQSPSERLIFFPRSRNHKSRKQEKPPPSQAISATKSISQQQRESLPHQTLLPSSVLPTLHQQVRSQSPPSFPLIYGACRKGASVYPKLAVRRSSKTKDEKCQSSNYTCDDNMSTCTPGTSSCKPNIKLKIRSKMCDDKSRHLKKHKSSTDDGDFRRMSSASKNHRETSHQSRYSSHKNSVSSSDTSETETVPTIDTILEKVIPLPENFEGQNNPFFDMDQKIVSKDKSSLPDPVTETVLSVPPPNDGGVGLSQRRIGRDCIDEARPKSPLESSGYQVIRSGTCSKLTLKRIPCNLMDKESHDIWTSSSVADSMQKEGNPRKCIIKAQRFTTDGKLEYLLEWE